MRELVRCSCNVMSKRYSKKVEVPSAPVLQIADYINSIKTKQENFELKLEQGNVNFQHILETLEDNELDKILEVLKSRKGTNENKIALVLSNNSWWKRPVFQWEMWERRETGEGVPSRVASDDGWRRFFSWHVLQSPAGAMWCDTLHGFWFASPGWKVGCYIKIPWTENTVNCEHETLRTLNRKQCNLFFRCSSFKSETVSRAGQIVWHWRWLYTCPTSFSEKK